MKPDAENGLQHDFSGLFHAPRGELHEPASAREAARLVVEARRTGQRLVIRGAGHSQGGQTVKEDAAIISTRRFDGIEVGDGVVHAGAGATVAQVEAGLSGTGQTLAGYPAYWGITLGGLIAVGGVGATSFHEGIMADRVTEMEVVLGTGEILRCGPNEHPDVFDAVRGTQGAMGIVTRVTIALRPSLSARHWRLDYSGARPAAQDMIALADDPACVYLRLERNHEIGGWSLFSSATGALGNMMPERTRADRTLDQGRGEEFPRTSDDAGAEVGDYHPWRDWFLPEGMLEETISEEWLDWTKLRGNPPWTGAYLVRRGWNRAPFVMTPPGERLVGYSVLPAGWSEKEARESQAHLVEVDRLLVRRGGKAYLSGHTEYGEAQWRAHYGDQWDALAAAKKTLDPDGVLVSGELAL